VSKNRTCESKLHGVDCGRGATTGADKIRMRQAFCARFCGGIWETGVA